MNEEAPECDSGMKQMLGLSVETSPFQRWGTRLPGECFEMLGSLELRAAVFCYSFAFPKADKELNPKEGLVYISQGKWGLGRGLAFPTG